MTMADDVRAAQSKGRSASICAPGFSSMEAVLTGGVPGTPPPDAGRRRRPAARSQSARLTGGKSIRRRAAAANQEVGGSNQSIRSGSSEPRLHETAGRTRRIVIKWKQSFNRKFISWFLFVESFIFEQLNLSMLIVISFKDFVKIRIYT